MKRSSNRFVLPAAVNRHKIDKEAFWRLRATPALGQLVTRCFQLADNVLIEGIETEKDHSRARQAGAGLGRVLLAVPGHGRRNKSHFRREAMRMTVRRYRRRRTGSDALGFTHSPFAPLFRPARIFEPVHPSTSQNRRALYYSGHGRSFPAHRFSERPVSLSSCSDYPTLDEAFQALNQWPAARLVVDIESRTTALMEKLDQLRRHSLYPPFLTPYLLVRADNYDTRLFCKAAGPFHVLERQSTAAALQHSLMDISPPQGSSKEWFSRGEWPILQELSRGNHYVRSPCCRIAPTVALSIA